MKRETTAEAILRLWNNGTMNTHEIGLALKLPEPVVAKIVASATDAKNAQRKARA